MEQRIVNAIASAIHKVFPDYPVYDVVSDQNVGRPAFFVNIIDAVVRERITHAGFFVRYTVQILFEPDAMREEALIREVQSQLTFILRRIPDLESEYAFRPYYITHHVESGILHTTFSIRESIMPNDPDYPKVRRHALTTEIKN